jgi:phenylalanyl-tRNA synthetase beta chain
VKINYQWLKSWVDTGLDAHAVAERFTLAGLEVDDCSPVAPALNGVVVGAIVDVQQHPDADRLRVCRVLGDVQERTIVCGAPNARAGLKVPLATLGSVLPGGLKIKPARLRGVASEGMLCSTPELGLGEDGSGLMELPDDAPVGERLTAYLGLDDHVLDIDLTPNRADCLSVRGLARELSALTGVPVSGPDFAPVPPAGGFSIDIELQAAADCPRYLGRIVRGVDVKAATPMWMVEALRRCGIRSLGPVVDVTNYVLLELGQPMHAFDLDKLSGGIQVRRARAGERMVLLDEREVELDPDMLLICDQSRALAIGGVMGGLASAVGDETTDILLESAWFNPASVIGRARRLGLATESAHRFERGVDPELQRLAMERATELVLAIAGGSPGPVQEALDERHLPAMPEVRLRPERVNRLLGTELSAGAILASLSRLGMRVDEDGEEFRVTPPSARRDIQIEVDLIEEVARLQGYDQLPSRPPGGRLKLAPTPEAEVPLRLLRRQLAARGFQEIMTWSFVAQQELARLELDTGAQRLENPLNRDMAVLRTSLLPGLLKTASANFRRQQDNFRLFETGTCFINEAGRFREPHRLALFMTGRTSGEHALGAGRAIDFFDIKGEVEQLLALNRIAGELRFERSRQSLLHPGQGADVYLDDQLLGSLGQVHPALAGSLDWAGSAFVAELDVDGMRKSQLPSHQRGSRFPSVRRDIAVVVPDHVPASVLMAEIRRAGGRLVEKCVIFDEYRGEGIETGHKSLAMGLILRDVSRTLTDDEVEELMGRIVDGLTHDFGAKLRG